MTIAFASAHNALSQEATRHAVYFTIINPHTHSRLRTLTHTISHMTTIAHISHHRQLFSDLRAISPSHRSYIPLTALPLSSYCMCDANCPPNTAFWCFVHSFHPSHICLLSHLYSCISINICPSARTHTFQTNERKRSECR